MHDVILSGLNESQKKAVTTRHSGPILVLAGAGCGKTTVLTRRIAFCSQEICTQERILALTFTRKAADEMRERLSTSNLIRNDAPLPLLTTFHAFGLRILNDTVDGKKNSGRIGVLGQPRLVTTEERLKLLAESSSREQRLALGVELTKIDDYIEQQATHPARLSNLPQEQSVIIGDIYKRMQKLKAERGVWDFSDMINSALRLLDVFPEVARYYADAYQAILVDEFQDTNPAQIAMLQKILVPANTLFAVGDDDQAIYGFRGADIGPTVNFPSVFPNAQVLKLEANYRSTPAILRAANKITRHKPEEFRKILFPGKPESNTSGGAHPRKKHFVNQTKMAEWIIKTTHTLMTDKKITRDDIVVLFRLNQTKQWMQDYFDTVKVPRENRPVLLTVHGSKGLEFDTVFLTDLEEEIFPNYHPGQGGDGKQTFIERVMRKVFNMKKTFSLSDIEEEQRLFYVGVTRAKRFLYLLSTEKKLLFGRNHRFKWSRFLRLV